MTGGEEYASGIKSKKLKPGVAKRVSDRKAFVSEKTGAKGITDKQANQRFFVQTRMAEMKAKGKTVTPEMRKQLQQKFQSGDVARKGFAAPAKKTGSSGSTTTTTKPTVTTTTKPTVKSYTYTKQSGEVDKRTLTTGMSNKPAYSRAQIARNSDKIKNPYNKSQKERGRGYNKSVKP
jgi:hypothetical protein